MSPAPSASSPSSASETWASVKVVLAAQADELVGPRLLLEPRVERDLHVDVLERRVPVGHDRKPLRILTQVRLERRPHRRSISGGSQLVDHLQEALKRACKLASVQVCHGAETSGRQSSG